MGEAIRCYWLTIKSIVGPVCNWEALQAVLVGAMHVIVTLATAPLAILPVICAVYCLPPPQQIEQKDAIAIQNGLGVLLLVGVVGWVAGVVYFWLQYYEIRYGRRKG